MIHPHLHGFPCLPSLDLPQFACRNARIVHFSLVFSASPQLTLSLASTDQQIGCRVSPSDMVSSEPASRVDTASLHFTCSTCSLVGQRRLTIPSCPIVSSIGAYLLCFFLRAYPRIRHRPETNEEKLSFLGFGERVRGMERAVNALPTLRARSRSHVRFRNVLSIAWISRFTGNLSHF